MQPATIRRGMGHVLVRQHAHAIMAEFRLKTDFSLPRRVVDQLVDEVPVLEDESDLGAGGRLAREVPLKDVNEAATRIERHVRVGTIGCWMLPPPEMPTPDAGRFPCCR